MYKIKTVFTSTKLQQFVIKAIAFNNNNYCELYDANKRFPLHSIVQYQLIICL